MALIDILVVVLVLAFVVSRFTGFKLPKDPRKPQERRNDWEQLKQKFGAPQEATKDITPAAKVVKKPAKAKVDVSGLSGIEQIKALDAGFDEEGFRQGVEAAYRYFYDCWNRLDEEGLDNLCGTALMDKLEVQLAEHRKRKTKPQVLVNSIDAVEITDAKVKGRSAVIEVIVTATQSEDEIGVARKGKGGASGPVVHQQQVRWVLARALGSDDPNWELQDIKPAGGRA
jgi:predicted lipid-binding transport protein (Tim44 family)